MQEFEREKSEDEYERENRNVSNVSHQQGKFSKGKDYFTFYTRNSNKQGANNKFSAEINFDKTAELLQKPHLN